jgi:hypothetical protein
MFSSKRGGTQLTETLFYPFKNRKIASVENFKCLKVAETGLHTEDTEFS